MSDERRYERVYILVDCNNFFVSCERIFRPDLRYKPVVVLSNNDGCVIAKSNEAKALKIAMGVPVFKVRDIIDNIMPPSFPQTSRSILIFLRAL